MFLKGSQLYRRYGVNGLLRRLLSFVMILQFSGLLSIVPQRASQALAEEENTFSLLRRAALFLQQRALCPQCPAMRREGGAPTAAEFQELSNKVLEQQRLLQTTLDRETPSAETRKNVAEYFSVVIALVLARSSVSTRTAMDTGNLREWLAQFALRLNVNATAAFANSARPLLQNKSLLMGDYVLARDATGAYLNVNSQFARAAALAQQDLALIEGTRNGKPLRENSAFLKSLRSLALLQLRDNLGTIDILKTSGESGLKDLALPADLQRQLDFTQLESELRAEAEANRFEKALRLQIAQRYVAINARLPRFATSELATLLVKQLKDKLPCKDCGIAEQMGNEQDFRAELQRVEREKMAVAFKSILMASKEDSEIFWTMPEQSLRENLLERVKQTPVRVFTKFVNKQLLEELYPKVDAYVQGLDTEADRVSLNLKVIAWKDENVAILDKFFKDEGERYASQLAPGLVEELTQVAKDKGSLKRSLRKATLAMLRRSAVELQGRFSLGAREASITALHAVLDGSARQLGISDRAIKNLQKTPSYAEARNHFLAKLAELCSVSSAQHLAVTSVAQGRSSKNVPSTTRAYTDLGIDQQLTKRKGELWAEAGRDLELRDIVHESIEQERKRAKAWAEWGRLYGFDLLPQEGQSAPSPYTLLQKDSILLKLYFDVLRDDLLDSFPVLSAPITRNGRTRAFYEWLNDSASSQGETQALFDEALAYVEKQARSNHEKIATARSLAELEKLVKSSLALQLVLARVPEMTGPVTEYLKGILEPTLSAQFMQSLFQVNTLVGLGMMVAQLAGWALSRHPAAHLAWLPFLTQVNAFSRAYALVFWGIFAAQAYSEYQDMKKSEADLEEISSLYMSSAADASLYRHADFRTAYDQAQERIYNMKFQLYSMLLIVGGATLYGLHSSARLKKIALDLGQDQKAFGDLGLKVGNWDEIDAGARRMREVLGSNSKDPRFAKAHQEIDAALEHLKGRLARGERWDANKVLNSMAGHPKTDPALRPTLNEEELKILRALERNWSEELPGKLKKEWGFE